MTLEFIDESPELKAFSKELRYVETAYDFGDDESVEVFQHKDGRYYQAHVGYRGKFLAYRKDFKRDNPYVVKFREVAPHKEMVEITEWKEVD